MKVHLQLSVFLTVLAVTGCAVEYTYYAVDSPSGARTAFVTRQVRWFNDDDQLHLLGYVSHGEHGHDKRILARLHYASVCDLVWRDDSTLDVAVIGAPVVVVLEDARVQFQLKVIEGFEWCGDYLKSLPE